MTGNQCINAKMIKLINIENYERKWNVY